MSNWNYEQWWKSEDGIASIKSLAERYGIDLGYTNDPVEIANVIVNIAPQAAPYLPTGVVTKSTQDEQKARKLLEELAGECPDVREMCGWFALISKGVSRMETEYYGGTDQIDLSEFFEFFSDGETDSDTLCNVFKEASGSDIHDVFWNHVDDSGAGDGTTYSCDWIVELRGHGGFSTYTTEPEWDDVVSWDDDEDKEVEEDDSSESETSDVENGEAQ